MREAGAIPMPPDARELSSEELAAIRGRLGLSQVAMARALGVGRRTYTRWELGEIPVPRPIDPATRALLAEAAA